MKEKNISSEIISRMMQAYDIPEKRGAATDLGQKLGTNGSVVSGWRTRGVPDNMIARATIDTGVRELWLRTGEGEMRPLYEQQPLLPPMLAEMVAERLAEWGEEKLELSEGAVLLVKLYNRMNPEQQRDLLAQATMSIIAMDVEEPKE